MGREAWVQAEDGFDGCKEVRHGEIVECPVQRLGGRVWCTGLGDR